MQTEDVAAHSGQRFKGAGDENPAIRLKHDAINRQCLVLRLGKAIPVERGIEGTVRVEAYRSDTKSANEYSSVGLHRQHSHKVVPVTFLFQSQFARSREA